MEIINILDDYLKNKSSDYAIMINGQWGSGKTYYWKYDLTKLISNTIYKSPEFDNTSRFSVFKKKDKIQNPIFFEAVYVSLYGLSDIKELNNRIFVELNPFLKKKGVQVASNIGKLILNKAIGIFGINQFEKSDFSDLLKNYDFGKNKVFCFDDLERLNPVILNDIFGFINLFTEHDNIKVIILCDEKEIKSRVNNYDKIKEKLIRFTYTFEPKLDLIYPNLIFKYSNKKYYQFLEENKNYICELYQKAKHKNLRTLKFNLDIFSKIHYYLVNHDDCKKLEDEILKRLLFFTISYCIEYKLEQDIAKLNEIKKISSDNIMLLSRLDFDNIPLSEDIPQEEDIKEEDYSELFKKKYLPYKDNHFDFYSSIAEFIHSGVLDENKLNSDLHNIKKSIEKSKISKESLIIKKLGNIYLLEDNELSPLINELLESVKKGDYQLMSYPNLFCSLLYIETLGINNFKVGPEIIEIFSEGIPKGKVHSDYIASFKYRIPKLNQINERYETIKEIAVEANESLNENKTKEFILQIIKAMDSNNGQSIYDLLINSEYINEPLFSLISPEEFFDLTIRLNNESKCFLNDGLTYRYSNFLNIDKKMETESHFFREYFALINNFISDKDHSLISNNILKLIYKNLNAKLNLTTN